MLYGVKMVFADKIKFVRKTMGMSQELLARELNVSFATINRWENSHGSPSRLAKYALKEFCEKNNIVIREEGNEI